MESLRGFGLSTVTTAHPATGNMRDRVTTTSALPTSTAMVATKLFTVHVLLMTTGRACTQQVLVTAMHCMYRTWTLTIPALKYSISRNASTMPACTCATPEQVKSCGRNPRSKPVPTEKVRDAATPLISIQDTPVRNAGFSEVASVGFIPPKANLSPMLHQHRATSVSGGTATCCENS